MKHEFDIISLLDHRNFLQAYGCFQGTENSFLVMEKANGLDLLKALNIWKEEGLYKKQEFVGQITHVVLTEILVALVYLAEKGITHRDLKTGNVMLCVSNLSDDEDPKERLKTIDDIKKQEVKIIDFDKSYSHN